MRAAQVFQHRPAILAGQHDVEHDQIVALRQGAMLAGHAVFHPVDDIARFGQTFAKICAGFDLVLDDQDFHHGHLERAATDFLGL